MTPKAGKLIKCVIAAAAVAGVLAAAYFSGGEVTPQKSSDTSSAAQQTSADVSSESSGTLSQTVTSSVTQSSSVSVSEPSAETVTSQTETSAESTVTVTVTETQTQTRPPADTAVKETSATVKTAASEKETKPPVHGDTCSFMISCSTVFDNLDKLTPGVIDILPADGMIFPKSEIEIKEGETVFDLILRVCTDNGIPIEYSRIAMTSNKYIEGIANLYEFDAGALSGWMYSVNGKFPQLSTSQVTVSKGDVIEVVYSCSIGADVGDDYFTKAG
ncbi:MAG: DUF4430 domain-containing protein [Ruminococcus sp.]|nr:DUF4430 domain-containing protein [Ruminococcus sp.]